MTTFVTAYLKVYDEEYDISKTFENRLNHFMHLLKLGINICIFIEPELTNTFNELEANYKNLKVIQSLSINELELYKIGEENPELCDLPDNRNKVKDTKKYMFLMLAKLEFLKKTIDVNPFNSNYFCWFDFSLPYIFKDMNKTLLKIKNISNIEFKEDFIYLPGCWNFKINDINYLKNNVVWRFCGGFLIGDKKSLIHFYIMSNDYFLRFLNQTRKIVWEVNYWAWLENLGLISPTWYLANHNDTIVNIPYTPIVE
jgi:hypothetical protein